MRACHFRPHRLVEEKLRANERGIQQHVVEVLNTVDMGTSLLVNAHVREDFTAETTREVVVETLRRQGRPETIMLDRDPRFVGTQKQDNFPSPLMRLR